MSSHRPSPLPPWFLQLQGTKFCQQAQELRRGSQASDAAQPWLTLCLQPWDLGREPSQHSLDSWPWKMWDDNICVALGHRGHGSNLLGSNGKWTQCLRYPFHHCSLFPAIFVFIAVFLLLKLHYTIIYLASKDCPTGISSLQGKDTACLLNSSFLEQYLARSRYSVNMYWMKAKYTYIHSLFVNIILKMILRYTSAPAPWTRGISIYVLKKV